LFKTGSMLWRCHGILLINGKITLGMIYILKKN
jgi:hypothetical protein